MAGTNEAFDAGEFREAIRFAMRMGAPVNTQERATFRWTAAKTYPVADPAGQTYDWTAAPTSAVQRPDVQVDVAVEVASARGTGTDDETVGQFEETRVIITVLDEEYELIRGANEVLLGGNTYLIDFVAPPMGLFDVTVYQLYATARDES